MKINLALFVSIIVVGIGWTLYHDQKHFSDVSLEQAPIFSYEKINGGRGKLSDHQGNIVLIHFWATWCAPCLEELPDLIDFATSQKNLTVLAVAVNDTPEKIDRFFEKIGKSVPDNFIIALDPERNISQKLYGTEKLPESFLLTPDHKIVRKIVGAEKNWNSDLWKKRVKSLPKRE